MAAAERSICHSFYLLYLLQISYVSLFTVLYVCTMGYKYQNPTLIKMQRLLFFRFEKVAAALESHTMEIGANQDEEAEAIAAGGTTQRKTH